MVEEIKGKFDRLFPQSPHGLIYWRDRIINGIKAAGVFLIGYIGVFVDQLYTALPQVKAMLAPYVGPVGVLFVGAMIVYLAENYFRKRTGPQQVPLNRPSAFPIPVPPVQLPGPNNGPASPPNSNEVPR